MSTRFLLPSPSAQRGDAPNRHYWPQPQRRISTLAWTCIALLLVGTAFGDYTITWSKIAGGGGTSTNGHYSCSGTVGQPDAGGPTTHAQYSVTGGFWVITLVQTPGAPVLHQTNAAPGFVTLWWTPTNPGYTLESTASLVPANWVPAASGTNNPATVAASGAARFFRLRGP